MRHWSNVHETGIYDIFEQTDFKLVLSAHMSKESSYV